MAWTAPRTWVAGEVVSAAIMNTHVRDNLLALGAARVTYTPTWTGSTTNPAIGNGTLAGRYNGGSKNLMMSLNLLMGSTTSFGSGNYIFTFPITMLAALNDAVSAGVSIIDASPSALYKAGATAVSATTFVLTIPSATGAASYVGNATPITFASGDRINVEMAAEAA